MHQENEDKSRGVVWWLSLVQRAAGDFAVLRWSGGRKVDRSVDSVEFLYRRLTPGTDKRLDSLYPDRPLR